LEAIEIDSDGKIIYKENMTEKIFHQDSYRTEMEATVRKKNFQEGCFRVYLDRTIFYPEGGGQPRDTGTINGIEVMDLVSEDDEIVHLLPEDPGEGPARLRIDPIRRYDIMQQHTGQHLLSQVLERLLGIRTLSFSITGEHASIELDRPMLTAEDIDRTETECQRVIFENRPVRIFESDDPTSLRLRKPPKMEGRIRVVEIDGYDQSACGGTHVRASGEIGMVKIVRTDRVRANVRIYFLAGFRGLRDYQLKHTLITGIQQMVTLPLPEIPTGVRHLIDERDRSLRQIKNIQRQQIEGEILRHAQLPDPLVIMEMNEFAMPEIKHLASSLTQKGKHVIAYTRALPPYIVIGRGSGDFDLRSLTREVFAMLAGKGGGRENLIEGQPGDFTRIDEVIRLIRQKIGLPRP
jgi:alanyl-tRNA synthetase